MKEYKEIQDWVNDGFFREVRIKSHAHGVIVSFHEDFHEIISQVGYNIKLAFEEGVKNINTARLQVLKRDIADYEKRNEEKEKEISINQIHIDRIKKKIVELTLTSFEK